MTTANPRTNHVLAGGTAVRIDLLHNTLLMTFTMQVAVVESRRRLHSAATAALIFPATARSTIDHRAFSVAAARSYNSLLFSVTSSAPFRFSENVFRLFYILVPSRIHEHSNDNKMSPQLHPFIWGGGRKYEKHENQIFHF